MIKTVCKKIIRRQRLWLRSEMNKYFLQRFTLLILNKTVPEYDHHIGCIKFIIEGYSFYSDCWSVYESIMVVVQLAPL